MASSPITLKTIYFGTGPMGCPTLRTLIDLGTKPALVVTSPDKPAGRGLKLLHSPIKEIALHGDIPTLQPPNVNDPEVVDRLRHYQADVGIIIAYGQKIGPLLVNIFPRGVINLHASLLPRYRGAAPINWAIINGETETGLTVMQINERIDTGKILAQQTVPIDPLERADELHDKLAQCGPQLVLNTIFQLQQNSLISRNQDLDQVTHAPKLSKALSIIDWRLPARKIADRIRGLWPWPTATSVYQSADGKTIPAALARAQAMNEAEHVSTQNDVPGRILDDFSVATGQGRLKILEIKPAGSTLMSWQDFINGRRVKPGDRFVSVEQSADGPQKTDP